MDGFIFRTSISICAVLSSCMINNKIFAFISCSVSIHTVGLRVYVSADVEVSVSILDSSNPGIVVCLLTLALRFICFLLLLFFLLLYC